MNKLAAFCVVVLIFGSIALSQDQPSTPLQKFHAANGLQ
jgi:hypothetical protein